MKIPFLFRQEAMPLRKVTLPCEVVIASTPDTEFGGRA
jgi:hypothetical protein